MADIIEMKEDGSAVITVTVEASKMKALMYRHQDLEALIQNIEDPAVAAAAKEELAGAENWYKAEYELGGNDGSLFLDKASLVEAYRSSPRYMTAKQRADAIAQAAQALLA